MNSRAALRGRDLLILAVCAALLSGLGETSNYVYWRYIHHWITSRSPEVIWMAPAAYLFLFIPAAAALYVAGRLAGRGVGPAWAVGSFAFLVTFGLLLPYGSIARWASALLSAGVGIRFGQAASRAPERWLAVSRRVALAGVPLCLALSAMLRLSRFVAERRALAALPAARADAPNILLIVFDTVRRADLGMYGYARRTTPRLDRIAAQGTVFDRALSSAPWTLPSHATLFTGRESDTAFTGNWRTPAHLGQLTLAGALRADGYATGGFTANMTYTSDVTGLSDGFVHYEDFPVTLRHVLLHASYWRTALAYQLAVSEGREDIVRALKRFDLSPLMRPSSALKPAPMVIDGFLRWQQGLGPRPFFAFLNFFEAHEPYRPPPGFRQRFATEPSRRDAYDGAIAYLDERVGGLLDSLQRRGILDRTVVIVTGDHGEQFGEHHLQGHANSLYLPLLEVPLIVRYTASVPAGRRVPGQVSLRDVPATILDLAGLPAGRVQGASLARFWRATNPNPPVPVLAQLSRGIRINPAYPNSQGGMAALLDGRFEYIRNGWGREELYDYVTDSPEQRNLAAAAEVQPQLQRLRHALDSALVEAGDDWTRHGP